MSNHVKYVPIGPSTNHDTELDYSRNLSSDSPTSTIVDDTLPDYNEKVMQHEHPKKVSQFLSNAKLLLSENQYQRAAEQHDRILSTST